jgi:hypothetical protein
MDQEQLVKVVTAEVLRQIADLPQAQKLPAVKSSVRAIAIFTGGMMGLEESLSEMKHLQALGFEFSVVLSRAAETVIGMDRIKTQLGSTILFIDSACSQIGKLLQETDLVLVPVLTRNTAAKLAYTIADTFVTTLVMQALLMGKPVIAALNAAEPQANLRVRSDGRKSPVGLLQSLRGNLDKLKVHGMQLVPVTSLAAASHKLLEQLVPTVKTPGENKKSVIGATDIKTVIANGLKQLTVSQGAIVTPLARDVARDLGVVIVEV